MKARAILLGYAAFLAICGFVAFAMSGFAANARTALIVGCGTAVVIAICGVMAGMIHRNRTAGMIGIHVGLVLPLLFAGAFGFRAYSTFNGGVPEKRYLAIILSVMAVGSILAFIAMLMMRPKSAGQAM